MITNRILFTLVFILLFACGEKQESSQEERKFQTNGKLVDLDSKVDILGENFYKEDFRDNGSRVSLR